LIEGSGVTWRGIGSTKFAVSFSPGSQIFQKLSVRTECPCRLKRPRSRFGLCGGRGRLKGTAGALTESYPLAWKMIRSGGSFLGEKRELYRLGRPVSGSRSPDGNIRLPQTDHWGRRSGRE
jgi:hypothetical protein